MLSLVHHFRLTTDTSNREIVFINERSGSVISFEVLWQQASARICVSSVTTPTPAFSMGTK
jgi:hypothetical protein